MYQALYRKWRPLSFADVIGQQHITDTLRAQITSNRTSHAYLFTGTRGTGKTTCAKLLARAVNCENLQHGDPCGTCPACLNILENGAIDVVEIDAASNNGVDNVREIRDEVRYLPSALRKKVYIIDEVHMLSSEAFNALLKTLEEPPAYVMFILATTEIHKVPATILSRCQRFDFRRITMEDIAQRLQFIANAEGIPLTADGAALLARLSDGAMRDALSMLDRTAGFDRVDAAAVAASLGILSSNDASDLLQAVVASDLVAAVRLIGNAYEGGRDLSSVLDQLLALIRDILLVKTAKSDVSSLLSPAYTQAQLQTLGQHTASSTLIVYSRVLQETINRMKQASNRRVEAELCMVRLCTIGGEQYDSLAGRMEALEEKVKHGIPMQAPQPTTPNVGNPQNQAAQQGYDDDGPPPFDENDAPPPDDFDFDPPPWATDSAPTATPQRAPQPPKPQPPKPAPPQSQDWAGWKDVLASVQGKINTGAFTCLKISARAVQTGDQVQVLCEDDVTLSLAKQPATKDALTQAVRAQVGKPIKVRFTLEDEEEAAPQGNPQADALVERAKRANIPILRL